MAPLLWQASFETGIAAIDDEHRHLVDMVNQADRAALSRTQSELEAVVNGLMEYAKVHFEHEERLMVACGYPHLKAHLQEHDRFRHVASGLYGDVLMGLRPAAEELPRFLRHWLTSHILGPDQAYATYLKGRSLPAD